MTKGYCPLSINVFSYFIMVKVGGLFKYVHKLDFVVF